MEIFALVLTLAVCAMMCFTVWSYVKVNNLLEEADQAITGAYQNILDIQEDIEAQLEKVKSTLVDFDKLVDNQKKIAENQAILEKHLAMRKIQQVI